MGIINLAHGDLAVLGAYLVFVVSSALGIPPFVALPGAVVLMAGLGYVLQRTVLERSLKAGPLVPLLTTFGLAIVILNLLLQFFTSDSRSLDAGALTTASIQIAELTIPLLGVVIFLVAIGLLGGLQLFLARTSLGRSMQATAQDPDTAELIGIDLKHIYALATAIAVDGDYRRSLLRDALRALRRCPGQASSSSPSRRSSSAGLVPCGGHWWAASFWALPKRLVPRSIPSRRSWPGTWSFSRSSSSVIAVRSRW